MPSCLRVSAGEIRRALLGEMAVQRARGLADFDQVAVRVSYVAANLRFAVDGRRDELRALGLPFLVAGLDVSDPQVQEDRGGVAWLVVDHRDAWLVASSAWVVVRGMAAGWPGLDGRGSRAGRSGRRC